jgi:predicted ATPase
MIGREPEFAALQEHFAEVVQEGESSLILISGEPGLGKSRLLNEFIAWVDLQPEGVWYFSGRGTPATQSSPYAVFRDLFALRFEILESDSTAQALGKFRHGMADYLEQDQSDLVGQLVGFDFSASPAVRHLLGSPSFSQLAVRYLASYFRQLSSEPVLIILEDFNWADDSSLDLALQLISAPEIRARGEAHLMMVCAARQTLFEHHPGWGQAVPGYHNLNLKALDEADSYRLVEEILKKAETIPDEVARRVVDETEGNPLFIE